MALQARRFHGKPLLQPNYDFRDVPRCARDLTGSTLSVVTERQHLVDSIAELTLLCNEATRRGRARDLNAGGSSAGGGSNGGNDNGDAKSKGGSNNTKPLSIEYIFDRIDTDDPLWGLMVRTDSPSTFGGRPSNAKASPRWKRGMLQGFILTTTFTNWQSSFRFDSLHEAAFGQDDDDDDDEEEDGDNDDNGRRRRRRKRDEDGTLAEELERTVKGGNPHVEGIVYPRIAEVSLFGGLGCGGQLLRLLVEHLECLKASAKFNYDYVVLQATDNSIPFYEKMGFVRVGCVQGKAPSPDEYHSGPVEEYHTKRNGETPATVALDFGLDVWDLLFLNRPLWGDDLMQRSWLKMGTKLFVPKTETGPKWHTAQNNETLRGIAKKLQLNFTELLRANKRRYPDLTGNAKLMKGTRIQVSRFHIDEGDAVAYSHWTFPDAEMDDDDVSYMMALKLNRRKGTQAKVKPVAFSLSVPMKPYSPAAAGVRDLLLRPVAPSVAVAPVFSQRAQPPKEPKKPKRPMTAYAHFYSVTRQAMAEELRGMCIGEVRRTISDKWKLIWDDQKEPYEERARRSKREYHEALKKYVTDMERFRRAAPDRAAKLLGGADVSLLEKVVRLKSGHGISGVSKFEYFYVLTFIPDLQWVHLIPMRKAGTFGPEHGRAAAGRPVWMLVEEDEGKEIDTTAALCEPVVAITVKNSENADDEQWNVYAMGETPPPPSPEKKPAPESRVPPPDAPPPPTKPKKPATSFALFCGEASVAMREELENKSFVERNRIVAARWKDMSDGEKRKYADMFEEKRGRYVRALEEYKRDVEEYLRANPGVDPLALTAASGKGQKSASKNKLPAAKDGGEGSHGTSSSADLSQEPGSSMKVVASAGVEEAVKASSSQTASGASTAKVGAGESQEKKDERAKTAMTPEPSAADERAKKSSSSALSFETPRTAKTSGASAAKAGVAEPQKKRGGRPKRAMTLEASAAGEVARKTPSSESTNKSRASAARAVGGEIREKKRGCPKGKTAPVKFKPISRSPPAAISSDARKSAMRVQSTAAAREGKKRKQPEPEGKPPAPKRKRDRKSPPASALHAVKADPEEVGKLLGKLGGGGSTSGRSGDDDILLSLNNKPYKEIMWQQFNILGKTRDKVMDGRRETEACDRVLSLLKQKCGPNAKLLRRLRGKNFEVDDVAAREKIITDIRRRVNATNWFDGEDDRPNSPTVSKLSPPVIKIEKKSPVNDGLALISANDKCKDSAVVSKPSRPILNVGKKCRWRGNNGFILSMTNDTYREIMWSHFRKLGRKQKGAVAETEMAETILQMLKKGLGKGDGLFQKPRGGLEVLEVNDDIALKKIFRDLKVRMASSHRWLESNEDGSSSLPVLNIKKESLRPRNSRKDVPPSLHVLSTDRESLKPGNSSEDSPSALHVPNNEKERLEPGNIGVILSLRNEKYKEIMWSHFRKLGRKQKGAAAEAEMAKTILQTLKKGIKKGGGFFKKIRKGHHIEVDDEIARQKIYHDLKHRNSNIGRWINSNEVDASSDDASCIDESSQSTPTCKRNATNTDEAMVKPLSSRARYSRRVDESPRSTQEQKFTNAGQAMVKPSSSRSRYPRRGSRPEYLCPPKQTKNAEAQAKPQSPSSHHLQQGSRSELPLPKNQENNHGKISPLGRNPVDMGSPASPEDNSKRERQLAPIFLRSYRKKGDAPAKSKETSVSPRKSSRYPGRKRKQINDDSHIVSDDGTSATSIDGFEPRKKRAKSTR